VLSSGNYVVRTLNWDAPGPVADVGAVTWGSGMSGVVGAVSMTNSLVGSTTDDSVGAGGGIAGVTALSNGNYVVASTGWNAPGPVIAVGAVTWGDGTSGTTGVVSAANSLVGSTAFDNVGSGVVALTNGNYAVRSFGWNAPGPIGSAGAVTWGDGDMGITDAVSAMNSLVGSTPGDLVGLTGVMALPNGNYVVLSADWDAPGPVADVGAATWGDGTAGVSGALPQPARPSCRRRGSTSASSTAPAATTTSGPTPSSSTRAARAAIPWRRR
jgi:hypothetical protein